MDLLDSSVANLAGPSIRADLGGGQMTLQWVLSAYTAAFAIGLVTSARLGDLLGRRRLFLLGMAGFTLASLACGLAPDVVFLIAARALQGLLGSVMIPQGLALMKVVFPPEHLRQAFIPFGPIMGLATVAGPILAGWLLPPGPVRQPVALHLPDQRPDRHHRPRARLARPAPPRRRGPGRPPRPHRCRPAHRGLGPAHHPAYPGTRARLARLDLRHDGRRGHPARPVRRLRTAQPAPGHHSVAVPQAQLRRRPADRGRVLRLTQRVRPRHSTCCCSRACTGRRCTPASR